MHQKYRGILHVFPWTKMVLDFVIIYSRWKILIVSYSCYFSVSSLSSPSSSLPSSSSSLSLSSSSSSSLLPSTLSYALSSTLSTTQFFSLFYLYGHCSQSYKFPGCFHHEIPILTASNSWLSLYYYHDRKPHGTNNTRQISPMN